MVVKRGRAPPVYACFASAANLTGEAKKGRRGRREEEGFLRHGREREEGRKGEGGCFQREEKADEKQSRSFVIPFFPLLGSTSSSSSSAFKGRHSMFNQNLESPSSSSSLSHFVPSSSSSSPELVMAAIESPFSLPSPAFYPT